MEALKRVLVDTGAWLALLKRDDELHERAKAHYDQLARDGARLVTTNYVVDETATRLRYDVGLAAALRFRDTLAGTARAGRLRIVWVDRGIEGKAWEILEKYADLPLSLTDGTTAAVARAQRIREIFAFDDEFAALGLIVAPAE